MSDTLLNRTHLRELYKAATASLGGFREGCSFLKRDYQGTIVGTRISGTVPERLVPREFAMQSPENMQLVLKYLEYHKGKLEGEIPPSMHML